MLGSRVFRVFVSSTFADTVTERNAVTGGAHALAEPPYHLVGAERWVDVFATLADFAFVEEKARRVAVVARTDAQGRYATACNGVPSLLDDYDMALDRLPAE